MDRTHLRAVVRGVGRSGRDERHAPSWRRAPGRAASQGPAWRRVSSRASPPRPNRSRGLVGTLGTLAWFFSCSRLVAGLGTTPGIQAY